MLAYDPLLPLIIRQLVTTIGAVGLFYLIVLTLTRLLRIKNPSIKYLFLTVPLIKGLLMLTREPVKVVGLQKGVLFFQVRAADPRFLPRGLLADINTAYAVSSNNWYFWPSALLALTALAFLTWRAYGLWRFNGLIAAAPEVRADRHRRIHDILSDLADKASIDKPKIVAAKTSAAPFTVGVAKPVIVLSPGLIESLSDNEMRAVLAHEMAHIARRDYLYHWLMVSLRDVLYFNPLTHLIYRRLNFEKEKACDRLASIFTREPLSLAKGLVRVAELQLTEPALGFAKSFAPQNLIKENDNSFSLRVRELVEPPVLKHVGLIRKAAVLLILFLLVYMEIHIGTLLIDPPLILT